MMIDRASLKL